MKAECPSCGCKMELIDSGEQGFFFDCSNLKCLMESPLGKTQAEALDKLEALRGNKPQPEQMNVRLQVAAGLLAGMHADPSWCYDTEVSCRAVLRVADDLIKAERETREVTK